MKTTRTFLYAMVAASLLLGSCTKQFYPQNPYRFNHFPLPQHNYKIDVFFPGEKMEDNEYVQTHLFEVTAHLGATYARMVERVTELAQQANVDGILIQSQESIYSYETKTLLAMGFKYKRNVDYLEQYRIVDQLWIFNQDDQQWSHIANMFPDFNNQIFQIETVNDNPWGEHYFKNYIRKYSLDFLLNDKSPNWTYRTAPTGILSERRFKLPSGESIRVKIAYNDQFQPKTLNVIYYNHLTGKEPQEIQINRNEKNQIVEKIILINKTPILREEFEYDQEGKLVSSTYYKLNSADQTPVVKTKYYFYTNEDVYKYF